MYSIFSCIVLSSNARARAQHVGGRIGSLVDINESYRRHSSETEIPRSQADQSPHMCSFTSPHLLMEEPGCVALHAQASQPVGAHSLPEVLLEVSRLLPNGLGLDFQMSDDILHTSMHAQCKITRLVQIWPQSPFVSPFVSLLGTLQAEAGPYVGCRQKLGLLQRPFEIEV